MATQFATASYQEIIDLNTEADQVSAIGIHTPSSSTPVDFLQGFWKQFQKFRYDGCSVTLVPAARLPVDPLGVSYDAGESQIDPRDLLNPILFHGCHGQDMGIILNQLYNGTTGARSSGKDTGPLNVVLGASDSIEHVAGPNYSYVKENNLYPVEALYYKALTDNTWKKADPSRGFKKSGLRPLVHDVAVSAPFGVAKHYAMRSISDDLPTHISGSDSDSVVASSDAGFSPSAIDSLPYGVNAANGYPVIEFGQNGSTITSGIYPSPAGIQFLTNRVRALGWLDTQSPFARQATGTSSDGALQSEKDLGKIVAGDQVTSHLVQNTVPKIYMGMFLLPPAYKTKQYYRMIINHRFSFAKFRGISMMNYTTAEVDSAYGYYNTMRNV